MSNPRSSIESDRQFANEDIERMKQLMVDVTLAAIDADPRTAEDWQRVNPDPGQLWQFEVSDDGAKYRIEGLAQTWIGIRRESDDIYQANVLFTDGDGDYLLI